MVFGVFVRSFSTLQDTEQLLNKPAPPALGRLFPRESCGTPLQPQGPSSLQPQGPSSAPSTYPTPPPTHHGSELNIEVTWQMCSFILYIHMPVDIPEAVRSPTVEKPVSLGTQSVQETFPSHIMYSTSKHPLGLLGLGTFGKSCPQEFFPCLSALPVALSPQSPTMAGTCSQLP